MLPVRFFAVLPFLFFALPAQTIQLTSGAVDHQVFQRGPDDAAELRLAGSATGKKLKNKKIEARLSKGDLTLSKFDWIPVGTIVNDRWTATIPGIAAGGPYRLELRIAGTTAMAQIDDILVGDLWILAGQSNMEGVGNLVDVEPPVPDVHSFAMDDQWKIAREPLHTLVSAADPVHWRTNAAGDPVRMTGQELEQYEKGRKKGAGLGLPFAAEMYRRTGIPVGLIPCAHGGTSMDQWSPALKDRGGESLYGSMYRRFRAAGGNVKGILWYQGESDANPKAAPQFQRKFEDLVAAIRRDFNEPDLPFYYVQIGRHINGENVNEWNLVQEMQLKAEPAIPHSAMIPAIDASLDDGIHVSTQDHKRLGVLLADIACRDLFPKLTAVHDLKTGPRPTGATFADGVVTVSFDGVNGGLTADGRPSGFSIGNAAGDIVPLIFRTEVDPAHTDTVRLYMAGKLPEHATVSYGRGKDPYCNLHDEAGMAVPVFGPMDVSQ